MPTMPTMIACIGLACARQEACANRELDMVSSTSHDDGDDTCIELLVRIADNAGAINEYSWLEKCRAAPFLTSYHGGNHHIRDDAYPAPAHAQRRAAQRRAGEVLSAGNPALATIATRRTPYGSFNFNVLLLT